MRYVLNRYVPAGSVILTITTFGSYVLGLFRDRIFAQTFGLSTELDVYNAAFLLPDLLFNLLVASGIAAAVVPLYLELSQRGQKQAQEYIQTIVNASLLVMGGAAVLLILLSEPASALVAPGLDAGARQTTASLMRILAFSPLLFALSNSLGAMLVAKKRFFFYGLSPIMYNLGIIGGVVVLAPHYGIAGAAFGTLIGGGLHASVRVIESFRAGWQWWPRLAWRSESFHRTLKLMLPKMIGHPIEMLIFWAFTALASTLAAGSISALNFARNFQSVPVSLIGITMSTAAFPVLTDAMARRSAHDFASSVRRILAAIFLTSTLGAIALYLLRVPLLSTLLGGGSFDQEAVQITASVLGVFCLAIPTESMNHLLARSFYARQNTVIPVSFSILALVSAVGFGWLLLPSLGILALPLGFFIGSFLKSAGLLGILIALLSFSR